MRDVFNKSMEEKTTRLLLFTVPEFLVTFKTSLTVSILLNGVKSVVERLKLQNLLPSLLLLRGDVNKIKERQLLTITFYSKKHVVTLLVQTP